MSIIYGIDLGTTNSVVSLYNSEKGISEAISPLIPSFVNMRTGEVGTSQKEALINKQSDVLSSYKINMSTYKSGQPSITASKFVLIEAKRYMTESNKCIITVPAYFQNDQRVATMEAAKAAGLDVQAIINEPTAAALYHSKGKADKFVVYDLGGGTFDVTVIDTTFNMSDVQATDGEKLGGDNLNSALCERLYADLNARPHRLTEQDERAITELCEVAKCKIQKTKAPVIVDISLYNQDNAFDSNEWILTPETYINVLGSVFGRTINTLKNVINSSGYSAKELRLVLVGGSTHDPYLVDMISKYIKPELVNYDKDRVVSLGAAYYGYLYDQGLTDIMVSDITKGIGIELASGETKFLITANSKLPIRNGELFINDVKSDTLTLNILQGNKKIAKNNECIGEINFKYSGIREPGEGLVFVETYVSTNGIVSVSCRESLGEVTQVELQTS